MYLIVNRLYLSTQKLKLKYLFQKIIYQRLLQIFLIFKGRENNRKKLRKMTTLNYESCQISGMNRENYFKSGSYDIQIFIRYVFFSLNVVGKWRQLENRVMQNIQYCVRCDATKTLNVSLLSSSLLTASSWSVINDRYFIYLFMPSNRLFVCICHKQPNGEVVGFFLLVYAFTY